MISDPDQVSIELNEAIFSGAAPPAFIVIDLALVRRYKVGDFLRRGRVGDVENANAGIEPGSRKDLGLGYPGSEPALRVVRTEAAACETEIVVRRVGRGVRVGERGRRGDCRSKKSGLRRR